MSIVGSLRSLRKVIIQKPRIAVHGFFMDLFESRSGHQAIFCLFTTFRGVTYRPSCHADKGSISSNYLII